MLFWNNFLKFYDSCKLSDYLIELFIFHEISNILKLSDSVWNISDIYMMLHIPLGGSFNLPVQNHWSINQICR